MLVCAIICPDFTSALPVKSWILEDLVYQTPRSPARCFDFAFDFAQHDKGSLFPSKPAQLCFVETKASLLHQSQRFDHHI